jgi:integrase
MPRQRLTDKVCKQHPPATGQVDLWDTYLPGFGLRISHGGRRTFMVMTRVNGKQRRLTIGRYGEVTLAEARQKARDTLEAASNGVDPAAAERAAQQAAQRQRRNTFQAVAEDYLQDHCRGLRSKAQIEARLRNDVLPEWADRAVSDIKRADVKELFRRKSRTAPVAANRTLEVVRNLFNWALDEELVEYNPAQRIKPNPETPVERVLSDDELRRVWERAGEVGYPFGPLVRVLILTGQRLRETAGMRWSDLDLEQGVWTIPADRSKSGRKHIVPLPAPAVEVLDALPRLGDHVFSTGRAGDKPVEGFSKAKRRFDAGCDVTDWTYHDLRRTVGTGMARLRVDSFTRGRVFNHARQGVTDTTYNAYDYFEEKKGALDRWTAHVLGAVQGDAGNVVSLTA